MATYYVSPTGSNTSPYDTVAKAANSLGTILAIALTGSNSIRVLPGSYNISSVLNLSDAKYSNLTISGADNTGNESIDASLVTLGGASASTLFYVSGGTVPVGVTIKNMTLRPNGTARKAFRLDSSSIDWVLENLIIIPLAGTGVQATNVITNATNITIKNVVCLAGNTLYPNTVLNGSTSGSIINSVFGSSNGDSSWSYGGISSESSGNLSVINSVINGGTTSAINQAGGGVTTIRNSVLIGNGTAVVTRSAGTLDVDYCALIAGAKSPKGRFFGSGATDGGHNLTGPSDFISSYGRGGFIIPSVDDGNKTQYDYVLGLEAKLSAYGMRMTWACYGHPGTNFDITIEGSDRQSLRDLIQRGTVEIASHTWSHAPVSSTITNFGALTHTDGTTKTYKIDLENHIFAVDVDGTTISVNLPTDNMMTLHDALLQIQQTDPGWGFAFDYGGDWTHFASLMPTSGFISITTKLLFNKSSATAPFYQNEITGYKSMLAGWINAQGGVTDPQTGLTYTPNSFIEPGGSQDTTSRQAVLNAGFFGARPILTNPQTLASVDLFRTPPNIHTGFMGATDAETIINVNSIAASAAINGEIIFLLSHDDTEIPLAKWQIILDALKPWHESGAVKVTSAQLAYQELRSSPWTHNGTTGISTRGYITFPDYRLKSTSPCIGAGAAIAGITTDIEGNQLYPPYNIGPYGAATGALEQSASDHTGRAKYNITSDSDWNNATPPDAPEPREASGWVYGTATPLYNADGTPKTITSKYDLFEYAVGPRLLLNPDKATKGLALYSADKDATAELKVWKAMGSQYALPTPTAFFNGIDTTGMTSFTGGSTTFADVDGKLRIAPTNIMAKTGMRVATTVAEGATLGSELVGTSVGTAYGSNIVTNEGGGWFKCVYGGDASGMNLKPGSTLINGKVYRWVIAYRVESGTTVDVRVYGGSSYVAEVTNFTNTIEQQYTVDFTANIGIQPLLNVANFSVGETVYLKIVSVKEVIPTYYDTTSTGTPIVSSTDQVTRTSATALTGADLGPELVTNSAFDSGVASYTAGNNAPLTWEASFGGRSGVGKITNNSTSGITTTQSITTVVGKKYVLSGYVYAPSSNTRTNSAAILINGLTARLTPSVEDSWVYLSSQFVATATVTAVWLAVTDSGVNASAGDVAYFDNISIKEVLPTWTNVFTNNPAVKRYSITNPLTMPGFLCEPARTNKCTCVKANPTATTNITASGSGTNGGVSVVTGQSAAMIAGNIEKVCTAGNHYRLDNSTGVSAATATIAGNDDTSAHARSARIKGGTCRIGISSTVGTTFPATAIFTRRVDLRTSAGGIGTVITADPGQIVDFILPNLEAGAFETSEICQLDQTASEVRLATVLTYPTAGKIRSNNMAFRMIVVPRGIAAASSIDLFNSTYSSGNMFRIVLNPTSLNAIKVAGSDYSTGAASVSYSHIVGTPIELIAIASSLGTQIAIRTYSNGWGSWINGTLTTTALAKSSMLLGTTFQLGCASGAGQFTGNISLFDALPIPAGVTDPLAWAKQQWGIA